MSGSTTELALSTAVDTDDNADYLTLSLANSLRTVDALFNSITGHNHGGAHQGGAIAPAAIPGGSITNAMLGADVARDNQLVNPSFDFWQRGAGPFTATTVFTADRWFTAVGGTMSVSQNTANADNSVACAAVTATGTGNLLYQTLQGLNEWIAIKGRTFSLSVRVNCATANACRVGLFDNSTNTTTWSAYHSGSGAYQTLSIANVVCPTAASQIQVRVAFDASCTAYVDNAMLVVGSQAANYVPMHPADDLARCLRYYEKQGVDGSGFLHYTMNASGAGYGNDWTLPFRAIKPVSPTITVVGTWLVSNANQPTNLGADASGLRLRVTSTASGQYYANNANAGNNIVAEANP
jgi:hypothetical protein